MCDPGLSSTAAHWCLVTALMQRKAMNKSPGCCKLPAFLRCLGAALEEQSLTILWHLAAFLVFPFLTFLTVSGCLSYFDKIWLLSVTLVIPCLCKSHRMATRGGVQHQPKMCPTQIQKQNRFRVAQLTQNTSFKTLTFQLLTLSARFPLIGCPSWDEDSWWVELLRIQQLRQLIVCSCLTVMTCSYTELSNWNWASLSWTVSAEQAIHHKKFQHFNRSKGWKFSFCLYDRFSRFTLRAEISISLPPPWWMERLMQVGGRRIPEEEVPVKFVVISLRWHADMLTWFRTIRLWFPKLVWDWDIWLCLK